MGEALKPTGIDLVTQTSHPRAENPHLALLPLSVVL